MLHSLRPELSVPSRQGWVRGLALDDSSNVFDIGPSAFQEAFDQGPEKMQCFRATLR